MGDEKEVFSSYFLAMEANHFYLQSSVINLRLEEGCFISGVFSDFISTKIDEGLFYGCLIWIYVNQFFLHTILIKLQPHRLKCWNQNVYWIKICNMQISINTLWVDIGTGFVRLEMSKKPIGNTHKNEIPILY